MRKSIRSSLPHSLPPPAVVRINAVQRLEHDDRVSADNTHAEARLLAAGLALGGLVEDDVEEDVVAAQGAHDFPRAVELHFDALVEVLLFRSVSLGSIERGGGLGGGGGTFLSSGCG